MQSQSSHAGSPDAGAPGLSLRVALLAWDYPPARSGLATAAREVAESLAARGHEVSVVTMDRAGWEEGLVTVVGAAGRLDAELSELRGQAGTGHLAAPIAFARALAALHAEAPLDVVEATNWYAPAACAPRLGLPLVTRCSTPAATTGAAGEPRAAFDLAAAAALERYQAGASAALISNTPHHAEAMAALYGCPPPGPAHAVIGLSLPPDALRRAAPPPPGPPFRLLFVGRATRRKGWDAVVEASRLLGAAYELRLVGIEPGGPDLPPGCVPLGRLDDAALEAETRACHAVLAPSRYESFGLVYQEAIAAGRPLVACAEDPAARAFVGEAGTGLLATACDGPSVAAAARALVEDAGRYEAARAACGIAANRFTRETLGAETEAVYRSVLQVRSQGRNGVSSAASSPRRAVSVAPRDIAP